MQASSFRTHHNHLFSTGLYTDIRDEIEELEAAVMARCEVRFQKQERQKLRKEAGSSPEATTAAQSSSPSASSPAEVFSHISAALIHGLPIAYPVTHQVEVVRPGVNRRFKSIHVRGGTIPRHHRQAVRGTEVTTLERTLIDVARTYNPDISVSMFDDALRRGLTTREKILQTLAQCLEIRNTKKVSLALDLADGRRESPAESIAAVRFFQHGFAGFVPQVEFDAAALRTKVRVDFCHEAARLIVEIDGIGKLYLGSGVPRDELERERRREQWLRDRDWRVVRISWKELFTETRFEEIRRILMGAR